MVTMLIVSILLVVSFVGIAIWRKRELPESISAIVFDLKHPWVWSVWLWAVTFTLAPALLDAMPNDYQVFAFGFLACMLFTGICPLFDTSKRRWHYPLAFIGGVFSQVCVWYICPWWLFLWLVMVVFVIAAFALFNDEETHEILDGKGVCIAELICYAALVMSILVH